MLLRFFALFSAITLPTTASSTTAANYASTTADTSTSSESPYTSTPTTSRLTSRAVTTATSSFSSDGCGNSILEASHTYEKLINYSLNQLTNNVNCRWTIANEKRVRIRVVRMPTRLLTYAAVYLELRSSRKNVSTFCPMQNGDNDDIPCLNEDTWTMMNDDGEISISLKIMPYKSGRDALEFLSYATIQLGYIVENSSCGDPFINIMDDSSKISISLITNITLDCVYYVTKLSSATPATIVEMRKSGNLRNLAYQLSIYGGSSTALHSALFQSSDFNHTTAPTFLHSYNTVTTIRFVLNVVEHSRWIHLLFQPSSYAESHIISANDIFDWIYSSEKFPILPMTSVNSTKFWTISGSSSRALEIYYFVPQAFDTEVFSLDAYYDEYSQRPDYESNVALKLTKGSFSTPECGQKVTLFLTTTAPFRGFSFWVRTVNSDKSGLSCSDGIDTSTDSYVAITVGVVIGALLLFGLFLLALHGIRRRRAESVVPQSAYMQNRISSAREQSSLTVHDAWYGPPEGFSPLSHAAQPPIELLPPPAYEDAIKLPTSPVLGTHINRLAERRNENSANDARQENRQPPCTVEYDGNAETSN